MGIGGSFAHTGAGIGIAARLSKAGMLQESAVVEECYKKVQWAMQTGVVKYPECLTPLTNSSSSRIPAAPARRSYILRRVPRALRILGTGGSFANAAAGIGKLPHVCRGRRVLLESAVVDADRRCKVHEWFSPLTNSKIGGDVPSHPCILSRRLFQYATVWYGSSMRMCVGAC